MSAVQAQAISIPPINLSSDRLCCRNSGTIHQSPTPSDNASISLMVTKEKFHCFCKIRPPGAHGAAGKGDSDAGAWPFQLGQSLKQCLLRVDTRLERPLADELKN